jgi:hypothetical protein
MALCGSPGRPAGAQLDVEWLSSIYFEQTATVFEHAWTDFSATFMKRKDDGLLRTIGGFIKGTLRSLDSCLPNSCGDGAQCLRARTRRSSLSM